MYKKIYKNMRFLSIFTLILSTVLILSACYTTFEKRLKEEIKNETVLIGDFLDHSDNKVKSLEEIRKSHMDKRISLISKSGKVIFDNNVKLDGLNDHSNRPEVLEAEKSGYGESQRYSVTTSKKLYYYAIRLNDGSVLRTANNSSSVFIMLQRVLIVLVFMLTLVYVLCVYIAVRLTDNIIKPIEKIYSFDRENFNDVYEEIQPFLERISRQNKEIHRQMEKIRSQKSRLQTIADNMNEGLIILDKDKNILSCNNCMNDIFNNKFTISLLEENEQLSETLKKAYDNEKGSVVISEDEKIYQVFYSPVNENNMTSGVILLFFDITQREKAQQIRREFSANVSHELKTPLTAIRGYAQIINNDMAKPEDINDFASKIEKESIRLINLIDDIIKLSSLDENEDVIKQELSLNGVCKEVFEALENEAKQKNVSLNLNGEDTKVYGNISQITQIIYNLCDNAVKYNKDGGSVNVDISDKKITISDTGIGIPDEYIPRIFERFFRVDKSHSKKINGTGLGLSIVKHAAMQNGAKITVESKVGEGTTFTVSFIK